MATTPTKAELVEMLQAATATIQAANERIDRLEADLGNTAKAAEEAKPKEQAAYRHTFTVKATKAKNSPMFHAFGKATKGGHLAVYRKDGAFPETAKVVVTSRPAAKDAKDAMALALETRDGKPKVKGGKVKYSKVTKAAKVYATVPVEGMPKGIDTLFVTLP